MRGTKPTTADSRFGAVLRRYRVGASLSQEELAERSGLSVRGISDLERGARTSPRLETVRLISDALQLSSDDRSTLLAAARPEIDSPEGVRDSTIARTLEVPPPPSPPTSLVGRRQELERMAADLLEIPHELRTSPEGPPRDVERLRLLAALEGTGLTVQG